MARPVKSILVEEESYGLEVLRYVVLNPVRAKLVDLPEEYEWSSHRAVIGDIAAPKWLAVDDVLTLFGPRREIAITRYRAFIDAGIGLVKKCEEELQSDLSVRHALDKCMSAIRRKKCGLRV